jgi:hypothetical protein
MIEQNPQAKANQSIRYLSVRHVTVEEVHDI